MTDNALETNRASHKGTAPTMLLPTTHHLARATVIALTLWGLLHIVGGGALMVAATATDTTGLAALGSAVDVSQLPETPNAVVQALIGFHGMNIAFAGMAVTLLSVGWSWRQWPRGVPSSLLIAGAADIGLLVYLLGPGYMKLSDGIWGPLLLAIALLTGALARRASTRS